MAVGAGPAGASLPTTLTFGSSSSLKITVGILTFTLDLSGGTDGVDPTGSVAVKVTGSKFVSTQTYTATGNTHIKMVFPAGTLKGDATGSSITQIKTATVGGNAPSLYFPTFTTGVQDCAIYSMYNIFYDGSSGTLSASVGTFRTHAHAGNAPGGTCRSTLVTYFDTYLASASISGTAHVT